MRNAGVGTACGPSPNAMTARACSAMATPKEVSSMVEGWAPTKGRKASRPIATDSAMAATAMPARLTA